MVRASETYGYPLGKAMQHRKSEWHPKGWKLEKVYVVGFSAYALWNEILMRNHMITVIQNVVRFSRCKVAAEGFQWSIDHKDRDFGNVWEPVFGLLQHDEEYRKSAVP